MESRDIQLSHTIATFRRRLNDYVNNQTSKSLIKDISLFSKTQGPQYGGSSEGPHLKQGKQTDSNKTYYLADHNLCEYFIYEILLRLGFNTPKARIIISASHAKARKTVENTKYNLRFMVASQAIPNYIPITTVRPDTSKSSLPEPLLQIANSYKLDLTNQTILNAAEKRRYKISGNLFVFDLAAILCGDTDLQPKANNLGVVKVNNRFYAIAIDKENCAFTGSNYYQLRGKIDDEILDDPLFKTKTLDQLLAPLYQMSLALQQDSSGLSDFDRIFHNPRIDNTPYLRDNCKIDCNHFKKSASAILAYYKKELGRDCLSKFAAREVLRQQIAVNIIAKLPDGIKNQAADIMPLIIEDLRGPYYSSFLKNGLIDIDAVYDPALTEAVLADFCFEFNLDTTLTSQLFYTTDTSAMLNDENEYDAPYFGYMYQWLCLTGLQPPKIAFSSD